VRSVPENFALQGYHEYIDECLPPESPYLYGLHPNAEIGVLTTTSENLFRTLLEMQPKDAAGGGAGGVTREEKVRRLVAVCTILSFVAEPLFAVFVSILCVVITVLFFHLMKINVSALHRLPSTKKQSKDLFLLISGFTAAFLPFF